MFIENYKKRFALDKDNLPYDYSIESRGEANWMVEEYMLLANQLVAAKLVDGVKGLSLLRKHEFPKEEKLANF